LLTLVPENFPYHIVSQRFIKHVDALILNQCHVVLEAVAVDAFYQLVPGVNLADNHATEGVQRVSNETAFAEVALDPAVMSSVVIFRYVIALGRARPFSQSDSP
jgi:hypothetical protein